MAQRSVGYIPIIYKEFLETHIYEFIILIAGHIYVYYYLLNSVPLSIILVPPPIRETLKEYIFKMEIYPNIYHLFTFLISRYKGFIDEFIFGDISRLAIFGFISLRTYRTLEPSIFKTDMLLPINKKTYIIGKSIYLMIIIIPISMIFTSLTLYSTFGLGLFLITIPLSNIPILFSIILLSIVVSVVSRNAVVSILISWGASRVIDNFMPTLISNLLRTSYVEYPLIMAKLGVNINKYIPVLLPTIVEPLIYRDLAILTGYLIASIFYVFLGVLYLYILIQYLNRLEVD